jgi:vacuolar iron transporter family protein
MNSSSPDHFEGKNPYEHVLQKKSETAAEVHGEELPGHIGAFLDASRDMSMLMLAFWAISYGTQMPFKQVTLFLVILGASWSFWKTIRSTWFSWSLLERLHRVLKEEQFEIDHHRDQEREELTALYASKGLRGELLEDVINVLMADDERLLKVMMEEEMGLNLENYEHPIKIGVGALLGSMITGVLLIGIQWIVPIYGLAILAIIIKSICGMFMAKLQKNEMLSAFIWNLGAAIAVGAISYFLTIWIQPLFI